jgi:hypothetical protein
MIKFSRVNLITSHSGTGRKITSVYVKEKKINVGKVNLREQAQANFYIRNIGQDTLIIDNVEVSCNCTALSTISAGVAPGDSVFITVAYTKEIAGYFYSDIIIEGNFHNSPAILSFEGYLLNQ